MDTNSREWNEMVEEAEQEEMDALIEKALRLEQAERELEWFNDAAEKYGWETISGPEVFL